LAAESDAESAAEESAAVDLAAESVADSAAEESAAVDLAAESVADSAAEESDAEWVADSCEDNLDPQLDQGNEEVIRVALLTFDLKR
jgi:hypothetical protein